MGLKLVWTPWRREKSHASARIQTLDHPGHTLDTTLYIRAQFEILVVFDMGTYSSALVYQLFYVVK
jgi:hypothetical protein